MADPDEIFMDGFDKYQNMVGGFGQPFLDDGEWTGGALSNHDFEAPLGGLARGYSLTYTATGPAYLYKSLAATRGRVIGGCIFKTPITTSGNAGIFAVSTTPATADIQITIGYDSGNGSLIVWRGAAGGTVLESTAVNTLLNNTEAKICWDIGVRSTSGWARVWVNDIQVINFTGDTAAEAGDGFAHAGVYFGRSAQIDHFYNWYYTSYTDAGETPILGAAALIFTDLPDEDVAIDSTPTTAVMGDVQPENNATTTADRIYFRRVLAPCSGNLDSISIIPGATSGTARVKPAVYADTAGLPAALLASGSEITGVTANVPANMPLTSPLAITGGQYYWLAIHIAVAPNLYLDVFSASSPQDATIQTRTYASGLPNPASPGALGSTNSFIMAGLISSPADAHSCINQPDMNATLVGATVFDTANEEDEYGFPDLPVGVTDVYAVALKCRAKKNEAGSLTYDLQVKHSGATGTGSASGFAPSASDLSQGATYFRNNPSTSAPFTAAELNASTGGIKLITVV